MAMTPERSKALSLLITANHILDHFKLIDGFGHVSVRDPEDSTRFYMSGNVAPAFIRSEADLFCYNIENEARPAFDGSGTTSPYSERFIHSGMYERYPAVNSVVHSHSPSVIAQGVSGVEFRPVFHMAGFLGRSVPVFDISTYYSYGDDTHDLLVNTPKFGAILAWIFGEDVVDGKPEHTVLLQRGHGFTTWGSDIQQAVYRAVYTQENAENLFRASSLAKAQGGSVNYLTDAEIEGTAAMNVGAFRKAWAYWNGLVEASPMYKNDLSRDTTDENRWYTSKK